MILNVTSPPISCGSVIRGIVLALCGILVSILMWNVSKNIYLPVEQQQLRRLKVRRRDVQQLASRGQQLQVDEDMRDSLHQDLQKLQDTLSRMDQTMDTHEQSLQVN